MGITHHQFTSVDWVYWVPAIVPSARNSTVPQSTQASCHQGQHPWGGEKGVLCTTGIGHTRLRILDHHLHVRKTQVPWVGTPDICSPGHRIPEASGASMRSIVSGMKWISSTVNSVPSSVCPQPLCLIFKPLKTEQEALRIIPHLAHWMYYITKLLLLTGIFCTISLGSCSLFINTHLIYNMNSCNPELTSITKILSQQSRPEWTLALLKSSPKSPWLKKLDTILDLSSST